MKNPVISSEGPFTKPPGSAEAKDAGRTGENWGKEGAEWKTVRSFVSLKRAMSAGSAKPRTNMACSVSGWRGTSRATKKMPVSASMTRGFGRGTTFRRRSRRIPARR